MNTLLLGNAISMIGCLIMVAIGFLKKKKQILVAQSFQCGNGIQLGNECPVAVQFKENVASLFQFGVDHIAFSGFDEFAGVVVVAKCDSLSGKYGLSIVHHINKLFDLL